MRPASGAVEGQAHVLEFVDGLDRFARQDLGRVLIHQVVAALDRVVHVPFPVVFFHVAERRGDAALGGAGVRAGGVHLGDDRDVRQARGLQRRHQPCAAGADDDRVELVMVCHEPPASPAPRPTPPTIAAAPIVVMTSHAMNNPQRTSRRGRSRVM